MDQRGQASVDYLALVLLVAAVLGVGGWALLGTQIGEEVVQAMRRALCIVTGGACSSATARPCVVAARQENRRGQVDVLFVRLGADDGLLREERADGTVAITLMHGAVGGLQVGIGVEGHLRLGHRRFGVSGELRAAALARLGRGETYVAPDARAADALQRRLAVAALSRRPQTSIPNPVGATTVLVHAGPPLPRPAETYHEVGSDFRLDASDARGRVAVAVRLDAQDTWGEREERATGRRTIYLRARDVLDGQLSVSAVALAGGGAREEAYAVTVDRDGRAVDLAVLSARELAGGVELPGPLARVVARAGASTAGGSRLEVEEHLDLTDPRNAAVARDFIAELSSPRPGLGEAVVVADALRARIDAAGTTQARLYSLEESGRETGGHVAAGVGLGGEVGSTVRDVRLLGAADRDGDGRWSTSSDCAPAD